MPLARPAAWRGFIRGLYDKEWVVYAKEPFGGPEQVLKYLTGYTHRVALSNHRLVRLQDDRVTFTWKDYADGCRRQEMTLDAVEFVRRFALHIVPSGFVRIRRYGLLAHRDRGKRLKLCRSLLGVSAEPATAPENQPPIREALSHQVPGPGVAPGESSPAETKPVSPSRLGMAVLAALIAVGISPAATAAAPPAAAPPAVVVVTDGCPECGVGRLWTIWQAPRPGRAERLRIPILDSS